MLKRKKELLFFNDADLSSGSAYVKDFSTYHNYMVNLSIDDSNVRTINDGFWATARAGEIFVSNSDGTTNHVLSNKLGRSDLGAGIYEAFTSLLPYNGTYGIDWSKIGSFSASDTGRDNGLGGTFAKLQRGQTGGSYVIRPYTKATVELDFTVMYWIDTTENGYSDYTSLRIQGAFPARADFVYQISTDTFTVSGSFANKSAESIVYPTGIGIFLKATSDTNSNITVALTASDTNIQIDGTDTSSDAYQNVGAIQLVQSSIFFPHAGETTGSSIAVGAESVTVATSDLGFGATEGMIFMDYDASSDESNRYLMTAFLDTSNRWFVWEQVGDNTIRIGSTVSGAFTNKVIYTKTAGEDIKIGIGVDGTDFKFSVNGGSIVTHPNPGGGNIVFYQNFILGSAQGGGSQLSSVIRNLTTVDHYDAAELVSGTT